MKKIIVCLLLSLITIFFNHTIYAQYEDSFNRFGQNKNVSTKNEQYYKWTNLGVRSDVSLHKQWTIKFTNKVKAKHIEAATIEQHGQLIAVEVALIGNKLTISPTEYYEVGEEYTLRIFCSNGTGYRLTFTTEEALQVTELGNGAQMLKVQAQPEAGFYWPYYIRIPSSTHQSENESHTRYVLFDMVNSGVGDEKNAASTIEKSMLSRNIFSVQLSEQLWLPLIIPAIPRSHVHYYDENGQLNAIFEHAFDRDSAQLQQILSSTTGSAMRAGYKSLGYDAESFIRLDDQVIAMFEHAVSLLNEQGANVETEKMFMSGFSASGTFVDRVSMLHPERVKAIASGATLDDMVAPLSTYNNETLPFPIGISDYEQLTNKPFNIEEINKMAKVVYMGAEDTNDTVREDYVDSYNSSERQIIQQAFGNNLLARAQLLMKVYRNAGGEAQLILEEGVGHTISPKMKGHLIRFFAENRDTSEPVYLNFEQ